MRTPGRDPVQKTAQTAQTAQILLKKPVKNRSFLAFF